MNFAQLHERLRLELLRRIQRGVLTRSMLARQTGFKQAHISNVLRGRRRFSLSALDRVLEHQSLTVLDLLPEGRSSRREQRAAELGIFDYDEVELVSHSAAIHDAIVPASGRTGMVKVRSDELLKLKEKCAVQRRAWQRFVAVSLSERQAAPMRPVIQPRAILVIDRHYNSVVAYDKARPSIFAIRYGNLLRIRYATFESSRLILRPHNRASPIEAIEIPGGQLLSDFIVGRVCQIVTAL